MFTLLSAATTLFLLTCTQPAIARTPVLNTYTPTSGPTAGGTVIKVTGSGFSASEPFRSVCYFDSPIGSSMGVTNVPSSNTTALTCVLPNVNYTTPNASFTISVRNGNAGATEKKPFTFFNLSAISITNITPNEGYNGTSTSIMVKGSGFVNTSEITCKVDTATAVPCNYVNSTSFYCTLPPYLTTASRTLNFTLNGDATGTIAPASPNVTQFTFFYSAPRAISCSFSSSYATLLLQFDRAVEIGGEAAPLTPALPNCSVVFDDTTMAALDTDATCTWFNSEQWVLVVNLAATSNVSNNTSITLRGNSIRTRYVAFSKLAVQTLLVTQPSAMLIPIPVLQGPSSIPSCGNLTLSAEYSLNGGYKPMQYQWVINHVMTYNFSPAWNISIPSTYFAAGQPYTVQLTAQNFLGYIGTTSATLTRQTQPGLLVAIQGGMTRVVTVDQEVRVEGQTTVPGCSTLLVGNLMYSWTVTNMSTKTMVKLTTPNSLQMVIAPYTLQAGTTYSVQLTVSNSYGTTLGSAAVQLTVMPSSIRALIDGGTRRMVYVNDPLVLNGAISVGFEGAANDIMVGWACSVINTSTTNTPTNATTNTSTNATTNTSTNATTNTSTNATTNTSTNATTNNSTNATTNTSTNATTNTSTNATTNTSTNATNNTSTVCSGQVLRLLGANSPRVVLPGGMLQVGVYNFKLTLQRGAEKSSWTQEVTVVSQQVPTVLITPPPNGNAIVTSQETIINATIASKLPGVAMWTNVYIQGFPPFDPQNYISPVVYTIVTPSSSVGLGTTPPLYASSNGSSQPPVNQVSLVLGQGSLLPFGNMYTFRLTVTDSANNTGFAETNIYTGSIPTFGTLAMLPPTGVNSGPNPIQTLQASRWLDAAVYTPLSYQFGMYYKNSTYLLSGILSQNYLGVVLPPLNDGQLMLFVRVYNTLGSYAEVAIATNGTPYSNFNATALLTSASYLCLQQGDWVDGLAQVTALAAAMNEAPLLFKNATYLRQSAMQLALAANLPMSKTFLNFQLSIVTALTSGAVLPTPTYSSAVTFLELIISTYNALSPLSMQGFSSDEASMVLRCYGNLLGANFNVSGERVQSNVVSLSLMKNINTVGYGLCKQLGLYQEARILEVGMFGVLKASLTNLERGYNTQCDSSSSCSTNAVTVSFSSGLAQRYRNWTCTSDTASSCSGVCVVAVQLNQNLRWSGSNYAWITGTPLESITLINPAIGEELVVSVPAASSLVTIALPITTSASLNPNFLQCGYWNDSLSNWSTQGCNLTTIGSGVATCQCSHLSQFSVVQLCPSGYYGGNCSSVCPQGLWGAECQSQCTCSNHGKCSASTGVCNCDPGWNGASCNTGCTTGTWGKLCANKCLCLNGAICDPATGSCDCAPGWQGTTCNAACPVGTFGKGCAQRCTCRTVQECDKATGVCSCDVGYTGPFCNTTCPSLRYGVNCQQVCPCSVQGTSLCSRYNGACVCAAGWTGTLCDAKIPEMLVSQPVPVAAIIVPLLLLALALAITTVLILVMVKKRQRKKKVYPVTKTGEEGGDGEKAERLPMGALKGGKVALKGEDDGSSEESYICPDITRAHSLEVLVPRGSKLKDLFPSDTKGEEFKEPPTMNGKLRWQIIQLTDSSKEDTPTKGQPVKEGEEPPRHGGKDEGVEEVVYRRGVYLLPGTTLRDLRSGFVETRQTSSEHRMFLFLRSDVLGDQFDISSEVGTRLDHIQGSLIQPQTVYIQSLERSMCQVDQCPCGNYAEMECSLCGRRGYCSERCQKEDWNSHVPECTGVSKVEKKKKKKKEKKEEEEKAIKEYTPNINVCVCGKEADFECSLCGRQGYCSDVCQQKDWKVHVHHCKKEEPLGVQLKGTGLPGNTSDPSDNKGLSPIPEEPKDNATAGSAVGAEGHKCNEEVGISPGDGDGGGNGGQLSKATREDADASSSPQSPLVDQAAKDQPVDRKDQQDLMAVLPGDPHVTNVATPTKVTLTNATPMSRTAPETSTSVAMSKEDTTVTADGTSKLQDQ